MNNAEIMSVARDKGFCHDELTPELLYCTPVSIERFAAAIRDQALEEAAGHCQNERVAYSDDEWRVRCELAEGIRALKSSAAIERAGEKK